MGMSFHAHAHLITVTKCCHGDRYVNLSVHAQTPTCTDCLSTKWVGQGVI